MVREHSLTIQCNWFRASRMVAGALVSNLSAGTRPTAPTALSPRARPVRLPIVSSVVFASTSCVFHVRHMSYCGCARIHASVSGWFLEAAVHCHLFHGQPCSRARRSTRYPLQATYSLVHCIPRVIVSPRRPATAAPQVPAISCKSACRLPSSTGTRTPALTAHLRCSPIASLRRIACRRSVGSMCVCDARHLPYGCARTHASV